MQATVLRSMLRLAERTTSQSSSRVFQRACSSQANLFREYKGPAPQEIGVYRSLRTILAMHMTSWDLSWKLYDVAGFMDGIAMAAKRVAELVNDHDLEGLEPILRPHLYRELQQDFKRKEMQNLRYRWEIESVEQVSIAGGTFVEIISPDKIFDKDEEFQVKWSLFRKILIPTSTFSNFTSGEDMSFESLRSAMREVDNAKHERLLDVVVMVAMNEKRGVVSDTDDLTAVKSSRRGHFFVFSLNITEVQRIKSAEGNEGTDAEDAFRWRVSDIDFYLGDRRA